MACWSRLFHRTGLAGLPASSTALQCSHPRQSDRRYSTWHLGTPSGTCVGSHDDQFDRPRYQVVVCDRHSQALTRPRRRVRLRVPTHPRCSDELVLYLCWSSSLRSSALFTAIYMPIDHRTVVGLSPMACLLLGRK